MDEDISEADANRNFSLILRRVREGHSYTVTSEGQPVARIIPVDHLTRARVAAREALLAHLKQQPVLNIGPWTRDELYDDDY